jgi:hypothetical protein
MNASSRWGIALIAAFALQAYARPGESQASAGSSPAMPAQTAVPASPAPVAPAAAIPEDNGKPVVKADTKDNFEAIVAAIHQQMQPGGRWQYIDQNERATLDNSFADMAKLYDQFGNVDKMDNTARMRLLADQSTVNAILTKKDGDRLICKSEMPVGSHLPVKTCRTFAQIQAEQNNAQEYFRTHGATTQQMSGH